MTIARVRKYAKTLVVSLLPSLLEGVYPGESPRSYAVYVDERDQVGVSDFYLCSRFDPATEKFERYPRSRPNSGMDRRSKRVNISFARPRQVASRRSVEKSTRPEPRPKACRQ